ncbi:hypothetical protein [Paenibacillus sophorae]|uniref:hypothetical protein n=1 Tax=Paenibacillus sophorae TaxID=1333845 RepID=UPI0004AD80B7|nr:hypothetical protein [Paenibacillus sophorae]
MNAELAANEKSLAQQGFPDLYYIGRMGIEPMTPTLSNVCTLKKLSNLDLLVSNSPDL